MTYAVSADGQVYAVNDSSATGTEPAMKGLVEPLVVVARM